MNDQLGIADLSSEIADHLYKQVATVIDGNHVHKSELTKGAHRSSPCQIKQRVEWAFTPKTSKHCYCGNTAVSQHFGSNIDAYHAETASRCEIGRSDRPLREAFMKAKLAAGGSGLATSDSSETIWNFGQHSVHETCSTCGGRGHCTCRACGGNGKTFCYFCYGVGRTRASRVVYGRNHQQELEYYDQPCNHCYSSGHVECSGCGGSGKQQCGSCRGHGFFTHITETWVEAIPKRFTQTTSALSGPALQKCLLNESAGETSTYLEFRLGADGDRGPNAWQLDYISETCVVEVDLGLRGKSYTVAAVGIKGRAFVRPAIFDDLFVEEIRDIRRIWTGRTHKLSHQRAREFFKLYSGQPVLDMAMQRIANNKESAKSADVAGAEVIKACHGYISKQPASDLGKYIALLLDKVSPPYSRQSWFAVYVVPCTLAFFFMQDVAERSRVGDGWQAVWSLLQATFTGLVIAVLLSPFAAALSAIVSAIQRQSVPSAYRQAGRNWELFKPACSATLGAVWLGVLVGGLAQARILPSWNGGPRQAAEWAFNFLQAQSSAAVTTAQQKMPNLSSASEAGKANVGFDVLILDLQKNLRLIGYTTPLTGTLDRPTIEALLSYKMSRKIKSSDPRIIQQAICRETKTRCSDLSNIGRAVPRRRNDP